VYIDIEKKRRLPQGRFITFNWSQRFMEKIERILERYKIYLGVKDVKLVVRPYKDCLHELVEFSAYHLPK
jgi:hypothetical protein